MKKNFQLIDIVFSLIVSFVVSLILCVVYSLQTDEYVHIHWELCAVLALLIGVGILWNQRRDRKAQVKKQ
ncbi:MAG: hypothetical protein V1799_05785 [bacterium]